MAHCITFFVNINDGRLLLAENAMQEKLQDNTSESKGRFFTKRIDSNRGITVLPEEHCSD